MSIKNINRDCDDAGDTKQFENRSFSSLSYLDKVKIDLSKSKEKFIECRKYTQKWKFYRDHIEWLEKEMSDLSHLKTKT